MLELITSYSLSQVPYITYDALEEYAEALISDFTPNLLKNPDAINVDEFLEYYLRLTMDYHRISHNRKILGIFNQNSYIGFSLLKKALPRRGAGIIKVHIQTI